ncbi:MAG: sensor histidine kinase [Opitutaceae bacterium]
MNTDSDASSNPAFARQRLAAVAAVSSLITHSGRNRLSVVRAALELLEARLEGDLTDEQRASFLRQIDLFLGEFNLGTEMFRCHEGEVESVSARDVATEALETLRPHAEAAGVALEAAYQDDHDDVRADRLLLRMALLNLLRNSLEAARGAPSPRIRLRAEPAGERYHLLVEDNGPGVPADIHDRLFKDFVTGRRGTTGLGLTLCRDAMTVMGGSIGLLTAKGEPGAVFRVELLRA